MHFSQLIATDPRAFQDSAFLAHTYPHSSVQSPFALPFEHHLLSTMVKTQMTQMRPVGTTVGHFENNKAMCTHHYVSCVCSASQPPHCAPIMTRSEDCPCAAADVLNKVRWLKHKSRF